MINASCNEKRCNGRDLSLSHVADQHRIRHAAQLLSTLSRRLCSAALLQTQADGLEQCMTIDPHACSLCQHEISEGVRNASDFESRQETRAPSRCKLHVRSIVLSLLCFLSSMFDYSRQLVAFYGNGRRSF